MNYNQVKSYIIDEYNTLVSQVDIRNWSGTRTSLANIKREVDLFAIQNPNHVKVVYVVDPSNGDSSSFSNDLSLECDNMTNKVNDIEWFVSANSTAPDFQVQYDEMVSTLKTSLKRSADRFSV